MRRSSIAIKGSIIGTISQIVNLMIKFIIRTLIINYCGKEILGIDSVLIDTISMLSLAEMGVTSVLIFRLYSPLIENNEKRISQLMTAYRLIYRIIALLIFFIGIFLSIFLNKIINGISLDWRYIYLAYYIMLINSSCSYAFSYKRLIINADQKNYLCITVDLIASVIFGIFKILTILIFKNYHLYLCFTVIQTISSNICLHCYAGKKYPYIKSKVKENKEDFKTIFDDVKEVLAQRIAAYIYASTDNILISIYIGTNTVGILSNYRLISNALKNLINSAMSAIQPIIGNYLNNDTSKENAFNTLCNYTFIRYVLCGVTTVPFVIVIDTFILIWTKDFSYLMSAYITVFLAIDYYIGCVYGPLAEYITGLGMFKQAKYASIAASTSNIVLSVLGMLVYGAEGVLAATVISQIVIWIADGYILFKYYFGLNNRYLCRYIFMHFKFLFVVFGSTLITEVIVSCIQIPNIIGQFWIGGITSAAIFLLFMIICFRKQQYYFYSKSILLKTIHIQKN